jgi:hypothetical protein
MTIDEQELSRLLAETANLASSPRFTADELTGRAGRRRARTITTAVGAVAAVAAVAVIVPSALSGRSHTGTESVPPPLPPIKPSYTVSVNGRTQAVLGASPANYVIRPGEKLAIIVDMTIPARTSVKATSLWMGITNGVLAGRLNGAPYMAPILVAAPRTSLGPGTYKFTVHWVAPRGMLPGDSRQLSTEFSWPDGSEEREIAVFTLQDSSLSH